MVDLEKSVVQHDQDNLAVYELGDKDTKTVYYGSGKIKTRLQDHLNKKECSLARNYQFEKYSTEKLCREKEEELLGVYKEKHGKLPIYNERIG